MLKQYLLKLLVGLAITVSLLGGIALENEAATAKVTPAQHPLACAQIWLPPC